MIAVVAVYLLSYLLFYVRMRKVGKMLGGAFRVRMNVALTLAVVIPTFLPVFGWGSDTAAVIVAVALIVSLSAGLFMIPSILIDAISSRGNPLSRLPESGEPAPPLKRK